MLGIWAKSGLLPGLINKVLLEQDRKSTRLNSSHLVISYAVFCLKKKNYDEDHNLTFDDHASHDYCPIYLAQTRNPPDLAQAICELLLVDLPILRGTHRSGYQTIA